MPHRCYMYCGQAVRTALAVGLADESMSMSAEDQKAARRTWWCIYSHEIDLSCSSGRRDSLRKPHSYQLALPLIKDQDIGNSDSIVRGDKRVAMINEMVHFAAILRRICKESYHDAKGLTLLQKSTIAKELDGLPSGWKSRLPEWLDFTRLLFREEEWAGKQKLVLHLRYLNGRILTHWLFLTLRNENCEVDMSDHISLCLDAARETIQIIHTAYAHCHYLRTWWYNSTYTIYAGMIVLYVMMLRADSSLTEGLLSDVAKAQNIMQSMQEATVAIRSADLLREGVEIVRSSSQRNTALVLPLDGSRTNQTNGVSRTRLDAQISTPNDDFYRSQTIFPTSGYSTDPEPLFASLIDPGLLQDFTTGLNTLEDLDTSCFLFDSSYGTLPGDYPIPTYL